MQYSTGTHRLICTSCSRHCQPNFRHGCHAIEMCKERLPAPRLLIQETQPGQAEIQSLQLRAAGHLWGCKEFLTHANSAPLHHLHQSVSWYAGAAGSRSVFRKVLLMGCYLQNYQAQVGIWAARTSWCTAEGNDYNGPPISHLWIDSVCSGFSCNTMVWKLTALYKYCIIGVTGT